MTLFRPNTPGKVDGMEPSFVLQKGLAVVFLASCALAVASLAGLGRTGGGPHLAFRPNPLSFHEALGPGGTYELEVEVVNTSPQPVALVGSLDYCASSCFSARGLPASIPARSKRRIGVTVRAGGAGPLAGELVFYTDRASQPTLVLNLVGTIDGDEPVDRPRPAGR